MGDSKAFQGTSASTNGDKQSQMLHLNIPVRDTYDGTVPTYLHLPRNYNHQSSSNKTAAILMSGAGGGVAGPSSMYPPLAEKLASINIPVIRMDYRHPARNRFCVADTLAVMDYLEHEHSISQVVLVGWSFGGAPVFTVGGNDTRRVMGCATVASQTAETEGITKLAPRPVLLMHGTADTTLHYRCSKSLFESYGSTKGKRELKLFEGDDHALTKNAVVAEELLCRFIMDCAGIEMGEMERRVAMEELVRKEESIEGMEKGGDLKGEKI
ncbi:MAG: hypothetical protein M1823_001278 [Watsoniomyces obsoletus]|nr:MAG: hypothetical protein M1823_001278 [Watsoniomyces obsoletus]